ncbi:peptide/nickel transport system substrate-binding protein/oligopeptide transport system substrate-binding protein [Thermosporothrix hazakensis]|jgi:peptide/nickel transport system substrate-binding protein/oligopeptide transport system substrate-binding protein|uniref:Peptide/nickel transport system substrate-binding protein/oligopeptide transport system substrate-binding protein n=1 Tax=Thermosporothrix hazakensis TaxID=644383 RepID=A0A326U5W9_THEHA|nr:peptide ABC transporter substrate-binding protein [Thermosporothrix hazakensis]PZW27432.1 peptide/nickel transport system substrate-binding protein/oligopeptide transport system substrate-binding protein [Thermosporothrix hazakensis]GCE45599.1 ABC transporter substrate-binding protein [Thermosporothrix hazakensis]
MKPQTFSLRKAAPITLLLMVFLLGACGGTTQQSVSTKKASDDKQVFVMPIAGVNDYKTLDPALGNDTISNQAIQLLYTGLLAFDDDLNVKPQLARSYDVASDGTTYTFKLKPNLKFSDGSPLTAEDVVYSINRALDPKTKSSIATVYMGLIKDADKFNAGKLNSLINHSLFAPDPQTVKIIAGTRAQYFLQSLTYPTSAVVNKKLIDKYGNSWTEHVGEGGSSGPFSMSKYTRGQTAIYEPNPYYYGQKPQLKKIVHAFYQNNDTAYNAYQSNQVDFVNVPPQKISQAQDLPKKQFEEYPQLAGYYITMNYLTKPFDNIKIRQAFALALDKEQIVNNIQKGTGIPTNHIVPRGQPGYNEKLTGPAGVNTLRGDQKKAKQLFEEGMKEAGYTRSTFPQIKYTTTYSTSTGKQAVEAEQQMWQNVLGVKVLIDNIDWNRFLSNLNSTINSSKGMMMWQGGWSADYPDPQDWLTLQFGAGSNNNYWNYGQTPAQRQNQELMKKADYEHDNAKRMQMYNQAEQQLVDEAAWIPIQQAKSVAVHKPCLIGFKRNALDLIPPDNWSKIYISTETPCADASRYR